MSKDGSIRISPKHGVNQSVTFCAVCGKDMGLALHGRLPEDEEAPRRIPDDSPCESCTTDFDGYKKLGFIFFVIDDEYEKMSERGKAPRSPWLFFRWLNVVRVEAAEKILTGVDTSKGAAFVSETLAKSMGLTAEVKK